MSDITFLWTADVIIIIVIKHVMVLHLLLTMALQAHLLRGDALFAMGEYSVAEDAYADALDLDPSIRRSKSFRVSIRDLPCGHFNLLFQL